MGLKEQREHIYMDMRGRVAPSKAQYQKYLADKAEKQLSSKAVKSIAKAGKGDINKVDVQPGSAKYREIIRQKIIEHGITQKRPDYDGQTAFEYYLAVLEKGKIVLHRY